MQNLVQREDKEVIIYKQQPDPSGFTIREMLETKNDEMRFQAGKNVMLPMQIPVYEEHRLVGFRDGTEVWKFEIWGNGRTKKEAIFKAERKQRKMESKSANFLKQLAAPKI